VNNEQRIPTIETPDGHRPARVLVVDDHASARESVAFILKHAGCNVHCLGSAVEAARKLQDPGDRSDQAYDVIITDLQMPGMNGIELIQTLRHRGIDSQIVMVTAHASVSTAVEAMRHGAFDYIEKPFDADQLEMLVTRALQHGTLVGPRSSVPSTGDASGVTMIGSSQPMQLLRQRIAQIAATNETVLIMGESGTGKELVARSIHLQSQRATGALVSLNCPVLAPHLMESELFGHERGAFTNADTPRVGRFELANGGTILLDEVTEVELPLQAKLLRVLQEKSFERVGSSETRHVDVRVLATTNRDLHNQVTEGAFRQDLYFRLAVLPILLPPVRERREDIPELSEYFLQQSAERLGKQPHHLDSAATDLLLNHNWPGNVRELDNIITRASVMAQGPKITADQIAPWLLPDQQRQERAPVGKKSTNSTTTPGQSEICSDRPEATEQVENTEQPGLSLDGDVPSENGQIPVGMSLQQLERQLIESTLEHFSGHREKTAKVLGIGVRTLSNKLKDYGYAPRTKQFSRAA